MTGVAARELVGDQRFGFSQHGRDAKEIQRMMPSLVLSFIVNSVAQRTKLHHHEWKCLCDADLAGVWCSIRLLARDLDPQWLVFHADRIISSTRVQPRRASWLHAKNVPLHGLDRIAHRSNHQVDEHSLSLHGPFKLQPLCALEGCERQSVQCPTVPRHFRRPRDDIGAKKGIDVRRSR